MASRYRNKLILKSEFTFRKDFERDTLTLRSKRIYAALDLCSLPDYPDHRSALSLPEDAYCKDVLIHEARSGNDAARNSGAEPRFFAFRVAGMDAQVASGADKNDSSDRAEAWHIGKEYPAGNRLRSRRRHG